MLERVACVVAAVLVCEPSASACTIFPSISERVAFPPDLTRDVPLNVEVAVGYTANIARLVPGPPLLRQLGGELVATEADVLPAVDGVAYRLRPLAPLLPRTGYEVLDQVRVPCSGNVQDPTSCAVSEARVVSRFTTGSERDDIPPYFRGVATVSHAFDLHDDGCDDLVLFLSFGWQPGADRGDVRAVRYHLYAPDGSVRAAYVDADSVTAKVQCRPDRVDSPIGPLGAFYVRAVDMAGNEDSNVAVIQTLDCGDDASAGGCTAAGTDRSAGTGAVGLALLVLLWSRAASRASWRHRCARAASQYGASSSARCDGAG